MHTRQTIGVIKWTLTPVTAYVCLVKMKSTKEGKEREVKETENDIIVTNERIFVLNWLKMLFLASKSHRAQTLIKCKSRHIDDNG